MAGEFPFRLVSGLESRTQHELFRNFDAIAEKLHQVVEGGDVAGGNLIPTAGEVYVSDTLTIPGDWNEYTVRMWATADTNDQTATGAATITAQLRWDGTAISLRNLITVSTGLINGRRGIAIVGRSSGLTATGDISGDLFLSINAQNDAYKADNGDLLIEATRTA